MYPQIITGFDFVQKGDYDVQCLCFQCMGFVVKANISFKIDIPYFTKISLGSNIMPV